MSVRTSHFLASLAAGVIGLFGMGCTVVVHSNPAQAPGPMYASAETIPANPAQVAAPAPVAPAPVAAAPAAPVQATPVAQPAPQTPNAFVRRPPRMTAQVAYAPPTSPAPRPQLNVPAFNVTNPVARPAAPAQQPAPSAPVAQPAAPAPTRGCIGSGPNCHFETPDHRKLPGRRPRLN